MDLLCLGKLREVDLNNFCCDGLRHAVGTMKSTLGVLSPPSVNFEIDKLLGW